MIALKWQLDSWNINKITVINYRIVVPCVFLYNYDFFPERYLQNSKRYFRNFSCGGKLEFGSMTDCIQHYCIIVIYINIALCFLIILKTKC